MEQNDENIPVNSGINQENIRDEKGRFVPGVSGNPLGKPKGIKHITTKVIAALEEFAKTEGGSTVEVKEALARKIVKMALDGNEKMIQLIWNYLDGKPTQHIELGDSAEIEEMRTKLNKLLDDASKEEGTIDKNIEVVQEEPKGS